MSSAVNLFLEPFTECAHSARIRTDTTFDQDCGLKANVQVCTACMVVSLLTTCMNFNTPPLAQNAPFDARFATQTRKYHSTKKLRKHVCHLILVCTIQSMLGRFVQLHLDHSSVSKRPAWLVYNHRPDKASALSLSLSVILACHLGF